MKDPESMLPGRRERTMTAILYGECVGTRETAAVRISNLADEGCHLETDSGASVTDGDVSLWIGAIGPLAATATRESSSHLALRFKEPLDGRILEHFRAA
ncbi:hypothetical protein [Novosphingobium mangrovi (ex Huang et al. 2023)]|uniref:PilZ domain-containing protein n=1 Tax=Novosphingobium mangrovi (ex Huang et al. 2023) TaxID=2976432 RepID=A0ABT2HZT8_9SPHN|nr:hypothetical protein [Novosphingobium mangrovi (ex Huang et al. 2023)]MCT2398063.1 hypothetical protein [Novosphingobium mangrovi (ex Huang et al. 2023)]